MDPLLQHAQTLASHPVAAYLPIPKRVAYVVSHGQSYASNGYAIRTQGIASALNRQGFEILCFVRPGRPWELSAKHTATVQPEKTVDGVRYIHSRWQTPPQGEMAHLNASVEYFIELFKTYRPESVLAASNWIVGLPAWIAAKRLGLPFYNEVRGFWDLSGDAREPGYANTPAFKDEGTRDAFVALQAQSIFTLNASMTTELVKRGISRDRIEIVPNGVSQLPTIKSPDTALKLQLGINENDKVIGYIGSFSAYEGLDTLLDACAKLVQKGETLKLLLVGDDQPLTVNLVANSNKGQLSNHPWVIQVGRVPHEQVVEYYALIDAIVIPRKKLAVCDIVPPMKVVEALAYSKRLLVSDVAALKEYAEQYDHVARFEAENAESLAQGLQKLLKQPAPNSVNVLMSNNTQQMAKALKGVNPASKQQESRVHIPVKQKDEKPKHGFLSKPETIELPSKDPLWFEILVKPGQNLIIDGASEYRNIKGPQNRKAVLLINSFDVDGKLVDIACGKMSKSGHLKAYFKYLPCTQNQIQELHTFIVPGGVSYIQLGLCGFNKNDAEQVYVRELSVKPKHDKSKPTEFIPPSEQAAEISILGWPEYPPNGKPYVIGIMDEFTTGCFEQDVNLIQPRPDNWYALAEKYKPEFFFIESAWKGNFGSWQYRVADYANKPGQEIAHICQYAKEKGIPTLFWNKEDPVHHDKFMCSAKLVDHIFTTDANMKASYLAKTGNQQVHALPFAAQPALHKPASLAGRKPKSCFAGSWYGNRHAERGEAMHWLLQAANQYGLEIYDRNYGTGIFPFPEEFQAGIKGSLPYKELCEEYSRYRVFLNVNSVTDSPTMFSRRVFELMACGTPIVSTYAKGIENLFDSDAVWLVNSQEEANEAFKTLMTDDVEWRRRSLAGIREVFAKHTYAHRLNDIFDRLGIEMQLTTDPKITLLAVVNNTQEAELINQFLKQQSYDHYQLAVITKSSSLNNSLLSNNKLFVLQHFELNSWLSSHQDGMDLFGVISPQQVYGPHYLRDLANASLYEPDAKGWAKSIDHDYFCYGKSAAVTGAIWKASNAIEVVGLDINYTVSMSDLYVADSDQFNVANKIISRARVVGG